MSCKVVTRSVSGYCNTKVINPENVRITKFKVIFI